MVSPDRPPRPIALSEFVYEIVDSSSLIDVKALAASYPSIPVDPYVEEGYRYKALAWLRVKHQLTIRILPVDVMSAIPATPIKH